MSNTSEATSNLPNVKQLRPTGRRARPNEVPVCWAPIADGIATGGYRVTRFPQFKPLMPSDPEVIENAYVTTGSFLMEVDDCKRESLHFYTQLMGDFDFVDYLKAIDHPAVRLNADERAAWLSALGKESANEKGINEAMQHLYKRKMYSFRSNDPTEFEAQFASFKAALHETLVANFCPPTYLMMSGWGLHCLWHLHAEDQRRQLTDAAFKQEIYELQAHLCDRLFKAHAVSMQAYAMNKATAVVYPEMDAGCLDIGTRKLPFYGVKNYKDPVNPQQTFIYPNDQGSSGIVYTYADMHARLGSPGAAALKDGITEHRAPNGKPPQGDGGKRPDKQSFVSKYRDYSKVQVMLEKGTVKENLLDVVEAMDYGDRVDCVCPFSGNSMGSAFIVKARGGLTRLTSNADGINYYDNYFGFYREGVLIRTSKGFSSEMNNVAAVLRGDRGVGFSKLHYDRFKQRTIIDGTPLHDHVANAVTNRIMDRYGMKLKWRLVAEEIHAIARDNTVDSLVEFINSLPAWDGTTRIDNLFYTAFPGYTDARWGSIVSRRMMIGFVARALNFKKSVKLDTMPILIGHQGIRKSTFWSLLFFDDTTTDEQSFFTDNTGDLNYKSKDSQQNLGGKWCVEVAELSAMQSSGVEDVKKFIGSKVDRFRAPFAREPEDHIRRTCFVGTSNSTACLKDPTGNRRFWPVDLHKRKLDIDWLKANREQLFAEAISYFKAGEQWWLTPEEEEIARVVADTHTLTSVDADKANEWSEAFVEKWHASGKPGLPRITFNEFLKEAYNLNYNELKKGEASKKYALSHLGWRSTNSKTRLKDSGVQSRVWIYDPENSVDLTTGQVVPE
jgi:predicted P-loop ATPase